MCVLKQFMGNINLTNSIISANNWENGQFKSWLFDDGMLFNSNRKWWGDFSDRTQPHEGIDLCKYVDVNDRIYVLDETTSIPAMHDARIVSIIDDFLGKSLIMVSGYQELRTDKHIFCSIFGHTVPRETMYNGKILKRGEVIASIAGKHGSSKGILPHLHVSLAWLNKKILNSSITWNKISKQNMAVFINPYCAIIGNKK